MSQLKDILAKAAPVLGTALGGPLGGAVVSILAEVFNTDPTHQAVEAAIQSSDPNVIAANLARAEAAFKAAAEDSITLRTQIEQHTELVRMDYNRGWFYSGWRPVGGWIATLYSAGFCFLALYQAYLGVYTLLSMAPQVLMIGGPIMAIAGIYALGKSQERSALITAGAGQPNVSDVVRQVLGSIRK